MTLYDDESTTGNTSGNLLNGGLFCEYDDLIYFANPYDQNRLYTMKSDLTDVKKLFDDRVSYLNCAGKYLFYTRRNDQLENDGDALLSLSTTGLFRLNKSGRSPYKLYGDPTQTACLYGNNVYYQHYDEKEGLKLYSARIDGTSDVEVVDEAVSPCVVYDDRIYYTGWDSEHYIHSIGIDGTGDRIIYQGNCANLSRQGNYLYFMDMGQDYSLCRIALDGSSVETLVRQRLASYNATEDGAAVYYQVDDGSNNGLYKLDLSSNSSELISSGNYNYLHLTTDYLFFEKYDQSELYAYSLDTGDVTALHFD